MPFIRPAALLAPLPLAFLSLGVAELSIHESSQLNSGHLAAPLGSATSIQPVNCSVAALPIVAVVASIPLAPFDPAIALVALSISSF